MIASWRNATIALALVCGIQRWQSCTRHAATAPPAATSTAPTAPTATQPTTSPTTIAAAPRSARSFFGFRPPAWAATLLPQAGELWTDYRTRIVPVAETAIAPQRARVLRMRARLPDAQRAALDVAATTAAAEIEARIATAAASGELRDLRPMTGVALARDVLDIVDRGNAQFVTALPADQRAQLAASRFDFADYLMFATPWQDAIPTLPGAAAALNPVPAR